MDTGRRQRLRLRIASRGKNNDSHMLKWKSFKSISLLVSVLMSDDQQSQCTEKFYVLNFKVMDLPA